MEEYTIAYPETSPFLANFLDNSYSEDHAERMSRVLAPICLLAGIVLAVLAYLFNKNIAEAVSTFTAIMCVSAPLTSTIAANLPLYRMSKKLIPAGAMVSGYSAVDAFSRTEASFWTQKICSVLPTSSCTESNHLTRARLTRSSWMLQVLSATPTACSPMYLIRSSVPTKQCCVR